MVYTVYMRIMGVDCSTKTIAYCIIEDGQAVEWGETLILGKTMIDKMVFCRNLIASSTNMQADVVYFEEAVFVNSKSVVIALASIFAVAQTAFAERGMLVKTVRPLDWQRAINNPRLTREEKQTLRQENPGKTKSWYDLAGRKMRKQRTADIVLAAIGVTNESDNVTDAMALALVGSRL